MASKDEARALEGQPGVSEGQGVSAPKRRLRFTSAAIAAPAALQPADDLLEGAPAIAAFMGWSERRVYHVRTLGGPIRKRGGLGLYALRSELVGWLTSDETLEAHQQHGSPGDNGAQQHP